MKKRLFAAVTIGIFASSLISIAPASADSVCKNGSYSSNSGRGTCSYNGGVDKRFPSYSDPGSSSYNRNNGISPTPSYGSNGNSRLGTTSTWGNTLNSKKTCLGYRC